jgi:purine nucleosidase
MPHEQAPDFKRPVWLDGDPGFDDWLCMLLLAHNAHIDWLGMSVVAGNAPLAQTLANALAIKALHGLRVPIHAGNALPLRAHNQPGVQSITAQNILGAQGLRSSGAALPPNHLQADSSNAVHAMAEALRNSPTRVTLLAIGPLTNVAQLFQDHPECMGHLAELVIMGGSTSGGNHTPAAEFNMYADPEAADVVFKAVEKHGLCLRMLGLNVCQQVLLTQTHVMALRSRLADALSETATCFLDHLDAYQRIRSADGSVPMPLYDPVVAAYLARAECFEFAPARVDIELTGQHTRGMTVCDFKRKDGRSANVQVGTRVQSEEILSWLMHTLSTTLKETKPDSLSRPSAFSSNVAATQARVAVLGSLNIDWVFAVPKLAHSGETVLAQHLTQALGGKGANQAVAAARMGEAPVGIIGRVGDDALGQGMLQALAQEALSLKHVQITPGASTGLASIQVDEQAHNHIVVAPGANALVSPDDIAQAEALLCQSQVLLCQLETPLSAVMAAIDSAKRLGLAVLLNPSPAPASHLALPQTIWQQVDGLILNESEAQALNAEANCETPEQACATAQKLLALGPSFVLLTLGDQGVAIAWRGDAAAPCRGSSPVDEVSPLTRETLGFSWGTHSQHLPAFSVKAVDSTGAGDCFAGTFAVAWAEGQDLISAVKLAQAAAALSVTKHGAMQAMPTRAEVIDWLARAI